MKLSETRKTMKLSERQKRLTKYQRDTYCQESIREKRKNKKVAETNKKGPRKYLRSKKNPNK